MRISTDELAGSFRIWLTALAQRQPSLMRDLWTRKGEQIDRQKIDFARRGLADSLAKSLQISGREVTREETMHDRLGRLAEEE